MRLNFCSKFHMSPSSSPLLLNAVAESQNIPRKCVGKLSNYCFKFSDAFSLLLRTAYLEFLWNEVKCLPISSCCQLYRKTLLAVASRSVSYGVGDASDLILNRDIQK